MLPYVPNRLRFCLCFSTLKPRKGELLYTRNYTPKLGHKLLGLGDGKRYNSTKLLKPLVESFLE